jgi:hypothetical protein
MKGEALAKDDVREALDVRSTEKAMATLKGPEMTDAERKKRRSALAEFLASKRAQRPRWK